MGGAHHGQLVAEDPVVPPGPAGEPDLEQRCRGDMVRLAGCGVHLLQGVDEGGRLGGEGAQHLEEQEEEGEEEEE